MNDRPTSNYERPTREIDLDLLVFVERYANNLLKWDLLTLFGRYPDHKQSAGEITARLGRSDRLLRAELADLILLGIIHKTTVDTYRLTSDPELRSQVIKLATNGRSLA